YLCSLFAAVAYTGLVLEFLVCVALPLTVFYHIAALLQFLSEHLWLRVPQAGESRELFIARLTRGRFLGEGFPPGHLGGIRRVLAWTRWWARMLLVHLPARVAVLPGDLP